MLYSPEQSKTQRNHGSSSRWIVYAVDGFRCRPIPLSEDWNSLTALAMYSHHEQRGGFRGVSFRPGDFVYRSCKDASHAEDTGTLETKVRKTYEGTEALGKGAYKCVTMVWAVSCPQWNICNSLEMVSLGMCSLGLCISASQASPEVHYLLVTRRHVTGTHQNGGCCACTTRLRLPCLQPVFISKPYGLSSNDSSTEFLLKCKGLRSLTISSSPGSNKLYRHFIYIQVCAAGLSTTSFHAVPPLLPPYHVTNATYKTSKGCLTPEIPNELFGS
ncbi:hypothetical protein Tco_0807209 [Tanacetum coccineum]